MKSEHIKILVNDYFRTNITSKSREQEQYIYPRMVYYALCREFSEPMESGSEIARTIKVDHATRLNGLKRFDEYLTQDFFKKYYEAYKKISEEIIEIHLNNPNKRVKSINEIENEYREKFFKLVNQQKRVIDNIKRKSALYDKNEVLQEVFNLPESDIREFEQMAKVFLKRKKRELYYQN